MSEKEIGMTVPQIVETVSRFKRVSRRTIYDNFRALGIKPIAEVQQHPQLYPPDSANRILKRYGLKGGQ